MSIRITYPNGRLTFRDLDDEMLDYVAKLAWNAHVGSEDVDVNPDDDIEVRPNEDIRKHEITKDWLALEEDERVRWRAIARVAYVGLACWYGGQLKSLTEAP